MARHAGFATVISLRRGVINDVIQASFDERPFFFPLPQTILVGPLSVSFGGFARIAAPRLELHANPQDLVRVHFAFFSAFTARVGGQPATRWRVRLDVAVDLRLTLAPQNGVISLWLDTSAVSFQPLSVTFLEGPSPPSEVIAALQSSQLAAAASAAVSLLPNQRIHDLGPDRLVHVQPASFKDSGVSVFNWFTVVLDINRVEMRVFDDAITIAADFAGITNGDRAALTDLTRTHGGGGVYIQRMFTETSKVPILESRGYSAASDLALSFNLEVLKSVLVHQISPQIAGTRIKKDITLYGITGSYGKFHKPLRGNEDGLWFRLWVSAAIGAGMNLPVQADIYIQPFLRTYNEWDGPHDFMGHDRWLMFVGRTDVDVLGLPDALFALAQAVAFAIGFGVGFPLAILSPKGFFTMFSGLMDGIFEAFDDANNAASSTRVTVQNAVTDASIPLFRYFSVSDSGPAGSLDMGSGPGSNLPLTLAEDMVARVTTGPSTWPAFDRRPVQTFLKLTSGWETLNRSNLQVTWEVRRKDTNAVVASGTRPYNAATGNGIPIHHHSQDLYLVSAFVVRYTVTMTVGTTVGEIASGQYNLTIEDEIDRSISFVEWGPKYVYFANEGTEGTTWSRLSRSRIHRTAVASRCKGLRTAFALRQTAIANEQRTGLWRSKYARIRYKKDLPFSWTELNDHRTELCEYCFFGGPASLFPYPRDDWFEPSMLTTKAVISNR